MMSFRSLTTISLAAAVLMGAAAVQSGSARADTYRYYGWAHGWKGWHTAHYDRHHRHAGRYFVPVASASAPYPVGYGMNGGYGNCVKRDPVWTTRGWRSDWVIDCAGKGAGYGGTAYYGGGYGYAPVGYGYGPVGVAGGLLGGLLDFGW